jgi:hypothetical protein
MIEQDGMAVSALSPMVRGTVKSSYSRGRRVVQCQAEATCPREQRINPKTPIEPSRRWRYGV